MENVFGVQFMKNELVFKFNNKWRACLEYNPINVSIVQVK